MESKLRALVRLRAGDCCEYCLMPQAFADAIHEIDHIVAEKHLGQTVSENLALACFACNLYKGPNIAGIDSQTGQITPLFHPRADRWTDHFEWEGPRLIGKTARGRATIQVLAVNL